MKFKMMNTKKIIKNSTPGVKNPVWGVDIE
jgi:hypothetical protein